MDIYLIRHTKTATVNGLCYGQTDVPLMPSFSQEAISVQQKLPLLSENCLIFSSPLSRCKQLAESWQQPIKLDARLQEVNFGDWEGKPFDDIDQAQLLDWTEHFVTQPPPNGECFNDLCDRMGAFWQELIATQPADEIVIVTHAGVIRALLTVVLQLPPANAFKFRVDAGSVHKIQYVNDYAYIQFTNQ